MLFWLLLAMITRIHENLGGVREKRIYRHLGIAAIIMFLGVSSASIEIGRRHLLSDYHYLRALSLPAGSGERGRLPELRQAEYHLPHNWRTAFYIGLEYLHLEDYGQAVSHFRRCLSYSPYFLNAHYNLGLTYFRSDDYLNAIRHFSESKRIGPTFADGVYNLALSWQRIGHVEEAERNYRSALAVNPDLAPAHNNLGVVLRDRKDYEEALYHFRKALEIDPDFNHAKINLDSTLVKLRQLEKE